MKKRERELSDCGSSIVSVLYLVSFFERGVVGRLTEIFGLSERAR